MKESHYCQGKYKCNALEVNATDRLVKSKKVKKQRDTINSKDTSIKKHTSK